MRKSKQQVVDELLPAYFEGRSDAFKERFFARDLEHQYICVKAWHRRSNGTATVRNNGELPAATLLRQLRRFDRFLVSGVDFSKAELEKIQSQLAVLNNNINNYEDLRRQANINRLEKELAALRAEQEVKTLEAPAPKEAPKSKRKK